MKKKIETLQAEVDNLKNNHIKYMVEENKTLTSQLEKLTRCECPDICHVNGDELCQGCKNKQLIDNNKIITEEGE